MLRIVLPVNMNTTLQHLERAGRPVIFNGIRGFGTIPATSDVVIQLRSYDIPVEIEDSCDIGLCGNDWVEEKRLELGIDLEILEAYRYGRIFGSSPSLDLVVRDREDPIFQVQDIKPGLVVLTEHPRLTRKFLEENGIRVVELGKTQEAPTLPHDFRKWCEEEGYVGMRIVHGRIDTLVALGAGIGVMVNETGETMRANGLRKIATIQPIETFLLADKEAVLTNRKGAEIERFRNGLNEAYWRIQRELEGPPGLEREI